MSAWQPAPARSASSGRRPGGGGRLAHLGAVRVDRHRHARGHWRRPPAAGRPDRAAPPPRASPSPAPPSAGRGPARRSAARARWPTKLDLSRFNQPPQRQLERACSAAPPFRALRLLMKSTSSSSSPASIRATSRASMPAATDRTAGPAAAQRVPHRQAPARRHPRSRSPRSPVYPVPGDVHRHARDRAAGHAEVLQRRRCRPRPPGAAAAADMGPCSASAATFSEMSSISTSSPTAFWCSQRRFGSAAVQRKRFSPEPRRPCRRPAPCPPRRTRACRSPGPPPPCAGRG